MDGCAAHNFLIAVKPNESDWDNIAEILVTAHGGDDPMAVLNSGFRVRGTRGLRVVDASVFPRLPGYFIVVPIYIMSERRRT